MLGPLGMTISQCLKAYTGMPKHTSTPTNSVFFGWLSQLPTQAYGSLSGTYLEEEIKSTLEEYRRTKEVILADEDCYKTLDCLHAGL
jgi:hypothetical protein